MCSVPLCSVLLQSAHLLACARACLRGWAGLWQVKYSSSKHSAFGLTVRSNGTAVVLWPTGKIAVMIDWVPARGGYSATASHHKTGAFALNFDAEGAGACRGGYGGVWGAQPRPT